MPTKKTPAQLKRDIDEALAGRHGQARDSRPRSRARLTPRFHHARKADPKREAEAVLKFLRTLDADKMDESILDAAVHDTASSLASDANNSGLQAQIAFLIANGWTAESLIGWIKAEY